MGFHFPHGVQEEVHFLKHFQYCRHTNAVSIGPEDAVYFVLSRTVAAHQRVLFSCFQCHLPHLGNEVQPLIPKVFFYFTCSFRGFVCILHLVDLFCFKSKISSSFFVSSAELALGILVSNTDVIKNQTDC